MEVACSLEDMARVLADSGYNIVDDSCFANAAYLPSVLASLDSPDSFPESPCSDEDIARVLDIVRMPSPSLLESCSHVHAASSSHNATGQSSSSIDPFRPGGSKTRDPCITNAVLPPSLLPGHPDLPHRGSQSPDLFSMAMNCSFPEDSSNFNSLTNSKDNDIFSHNFYFNSSSALSPVSETDTILPGSLDNLNKCSQVSSHHVFDVRVENHLQHQTSVESLTSDTSVDTNNIISKSEIKITTDPVEKSPTKRKRRRKNSQVASKAKKKKQDNSKHTTKPIPKEKTVINVKNKQNETNANSNKKKPTPSKAKSGGRQAKQENKTIIDNNIPDTAVTVSPKEEQSAIESDQSQSSGIGSTNGTPAEGTGLRRSSRATKNTENYNFRMSSLVKRVETERKQTEPRKPKGKAKPPPLSKYRRRTANARERDRMKEINDAFDTLKDALPEMEPDDGKNKVTKFTILKLALNYISSLQEMLEDDPAPEQDSGESSRVDLPPPPCTSFITEPYPSDKFSDACVNILTNDCTQNEYTKPLPVSAPSEKSFKL